MKHTKRHQKGFTLAELLIVVAVVAVLVAVSVPIFASRLEKSRESTDMANMRSAKAAAVLALMEDNYAGTPMYYDAEKGILVGRGLDRQNINPYGKGTRAEGDPDNDQDGYQPDVSYVDGIICVTFTEDQATLEWINGNRFADDYRIDGTRAVKVGGN